jgi:hypothetical protein
MWYKRIPDTRKAIVIGTPESSSRSAARLLLAALKKLLSTSTGDSDQAKVITELKEEKVRKPSIIVASLEANRVFWGLSGMC